MNPKDKPDYSLLDIIKDEWKEQEIRISKIEDEKERQAERVGSVGEGR